MNKTVPGPGAQHPKWVHAELAGPTSKSSGDHGLRHGLWIALSLIVFYLVSSLWIAAHRRFWYDEISTVLNARVSSYGTIWQALANSSDVLPPGYFMVVRFFDRIFGPGEIAARIPSALAVAFGLLITFDSARRLSDNLHAIGAIAVLSCSILPYYGYEARSYGLYFMLVAFQLWLWIHAPNNSISAILFGLTVFIAFNLHYYSAVCLLPFGVFELTQWKRGRLLPSKKLTAGAVGVVCGVGFLTKHIQGAHQSSAGFWSPPSRNALFRIFGEFFPLGFVAGALALMWVAWRAGQEKPVVAPMTDGERLGWYFFTIPIGGFMVAKLVTNAFYNRYFIGILAGVAVAFACALWRHFRHRPTISAGLIAILLLVGFGRHASLAARPARVVPISWEGAPAKLNDMLKQEEVALKDAKKFIAVPADSHLALETHYYSKHPENYVLLTTPTMDIRAATLASTVRNLSKYHPLRFWTLDDLRASARVTALVDPSDELVQSMIDAGFRPIKIFSTHDNPSDELTIVYLE